jgi:hypothetical protein
MAKGQKSLCSILHTRQPWGGNEQVYVCARLGALDGTELRRGSEEQRRRKADYYVAKFGGDYDAAERLVLAVQSDTVIDRIVDDATPYISRGFPIIFATPHPPFDDEMSVGAGLETGRPLRNVIPHQYAAHLAAMLDGQIDTEIVQSARVGRTKLTRFERLLYQPAFEGAINHDAAYILVDDVCTSGGTLAALRNHILANGGTICSITTLAHGTGEWRKLALSRETWQKLSAHFGEGLKTFWMKEIGHDAAHLTETEGRTLVGWAEGESGNGDALIQRLRDRLLETAGNSERRKSARGG